MELKTLVILLFSLYSVNAQIGVNLVNGNAFVDIVKHTNRYQDVSSFDGNGWPQSDFKLVLMDGRPVAEWAGQIDDPEKYRIDYTGTYHSSFSGKANISLWGSNAYIENKYYDSLKNTTYFDLVIPKPIEDNHGIVLLTFSNTQRNAESPINTGITNLKVYRPGYDLNTDKIFTDEYIALCKAADFDCYRYYDVQNIWNGEPSFPNKTTWDERKTPNDACQIDMKNLNGKADGWCWEYIIKLANILQKDIWINIHISCDSIYVNNLALMLRDSLDENINIYVENSNEVWSPTFKTHGPYNQAQADYYGITFDQNYARRTVELSKWFAEVFGEEQINKRICVILAGQHAYPGRSDNHLNYINQTFGSPNKYIYATSTALYFGSTKSNLNDPMEINNGMLEDIREQIENYQANTYRLNHINKAKHWNLVGGCTSYEGGPGIPSSGNLNNLANQILAHRTEKMKDVIKYSYEDGWFRLGGGLALYFTLYSGYNRYGCWGLTDDFSNPDRNYKFQAIRELISSQTQVNLKSENKIKLYPNPANDYLTIENLNYLQIKIYNLLGIEVEYRIVQSTSKFTTIYIPNIQPGYYFIKIDKVDKIIPFVKE